MLEKKTEGILYGLNCRLRELFPALNASCASSAIIELKCGANLGLEHRVPPFLPNTIAPLVMAGKENHCFRLLRAQDEVRDPNPPWSGGLEHLSTTCAGTEEHKYPCKSSNGSKLQVTQTTNCVTVARSLVCIGTRARWAGVASAVLPKHVAWTLGARISSPRRSTAISAWSAHTPASR